MGDTPADTGTSKSQGVPINDEDSAFVRSVLGDTEDVWKSVYQKQLGRNIPRQSWCYLRAAVRSACGAAQQQMGPFYCPADEKVYLDMGFFKHIRAAAGKNDEFARAYAIAHEIGHHIQNVTGIMDKVQAQRQQVDEATSNNLSVRIELQADCLAGYGVTTLPAATSSTRDDLQDAFNTAAQIGDDYLQKQAKGHTSPESWTHGSSEQRMRWFTVGLKEWRHQQVQYI